MGYILMRPRLPAVDARALGALCDACPFDGQRPTLPTLPKDGEPPKLTVLLEGAGDIEEIIGKAAQGKTGVWLNKIWKVLNETQKKRGLREVSRDDAAIRNSTMCRPTEKSSEGSLREAVECCRPRLERELRGEVDGGVASVGRHLVLLCGGKALQAVTGKTSLDDWRGYPVEPNQLGGTPPGYIFFPTYHPMFVARKPQYWHIFRRDLRIAWDYAYGRIAPMAWPTLYLDNDSATEQFLFDLCERLEDGEALDVGVDVETAGDWTTKLLLVGIATTGGSVSMLYPFANEHIEAYARFILSHPLATLVVQNGNHDALSLEKHGFKLSSKRWDTIVASRVAYPDLPHDLGFLATLFFFCNRWKSEFHAGSSQDKKGDEGWDRFLKPTHLHNFLKYNACDALSQVLMKAPLERRLAYEPRR